MGASSVPPRLPFASGPPLTYRRLRCALAISVAVLTVISGAALTGSAAVDRAPATAASHGPTFHSVDAKGMAPVAASRSATTPSLPSLNVSVSPSTICSANWSACPAGATAARATVQVLPPAAQSGSNWTSVDLLFLLETTPYDGGYDNAAGDTGSDSCAPSTGYLCEEASLLRTFGTNAGSIASSIAAAHPGVEVQFGLVDYFETTSFNDGDGNQYHVDVGHFVAANAFGKAVNDSLLNLTGGVLVPPEMILPDSDMSDNFLTTSSISVMYLALFGADLNWSNSTHHVVVQLGSSAPQDPNYVENYCVSASDYSRFSSSCLSQTCEPSITYANVTSPACVGWVAGPANNTNASIAQYASSAPACANSTGSQCTIDSIDVFDTPTDPNSVGWPTGLSNGGGPGGINTTLDSDHILEAGCNIATATGGSWDGPDFYSCNGGNGTLNYSGVSSHDSSLLASLTQISFGNGAVPGFLGANSAAPLLQMVIAPGVALALDPAYSATCAGPTASGTCPQVPTLSTVGELAVLEWNWSYVPSDNFLVSGDSWTVDFNVTAAVGASGTVPLYLCSTVDCLSAGAGPADGLASTLSGRLGTGTGAPSWSGSLPLLQLSIESPPDLQVALSASSDLGEAPFSVTFQSTVHGGVAPENEMIDFGDGETDVGSSPVTHVYAAGHFTAMAYVVDAFGHVAQSTVAVTVLAPLQTWFVENLSTGSAPLPVAFTASTLSGEGPYSFDWAFGDGTTSTLAAPDHTYTSAGTWNVTLEVTDALGYTQSSSGQVVVEPTSTSTSPPHTGTPPAGSGHTAGSSSMMGSPYLVYAGITVAGLAVVVAAALLLSRRGDRRPPNGAIVR